MTKFKPGDRVYKRGTVLPDEHGKLVVKYETTICVSEVFHGMGMIRRISATKLYDYIGKRVEVTVRLIEENL